MTNALKAICSFASAALLAASIALPASAQLTAGKEYQLLTPPQSTASGDKIEVIEFFYYGCPYCNEAYPLIQKWMPTLPADVQYRRIPVVRPDKWAPLARTFYTLEAMNMLELHHHVFDSLFLDNLSLSDEAAMFDWAERNHMDRKKFIEIYKSAETTAKVEKAKQMTETYGITRIPAFVVDGKYLTTSNQAGSLQLLLPTVDKLVVLARTEHAKK
jgi:thiol:disulfide interchange protein DsbA